VREVFYRERWGRVYKRFKELSSLDLHIEDLKKLSSGDRKSR